MFFMAPCSHIFLQNQKTQFQEIIKKTWFSFRLMALDFFANFKNCFFDVSPKKTVLHSATGKSSSLRRDDEKREQYQWTRTAQTRTAQQERKARMAHKERRTKREQHTTKGQQRRNQYTFFGASVDLARSMVGQLFSSCWRTGENAKDWMSSSNSKNSKHKKKAKTDTN